MGQDWVLVAVARGRLTGADVAMRDAAASVGAEAGAVSVLAQDAPLAAYELRVRLPAMGAAQDLRRAAEARMHADIAVLPAQGRRKRLLISDMDSTIIGQECIDEIADFAGIKSEIAAITERAMRGELDFEAALKTRVGMLKGLSETVLQRTFDERLSLNSGARTLTATMRAHGAASVLVSGGFSFFTERVAEAAGFDFHRSNTLEFSRGKLTGTVTEPILGRAAKLSALDDFAARLKLTRADALALGDGANDLDMIKAAGLGLAYKAKPIVAAEAHAHIQYTDLTAALFFQGYAAGEFAES